MTCDAPCSFAGAIESIRGKLRLVSGEMLSRPLEPPRAANLHASLPGIRAVEDVRASVCGAVVQSFVRQRELSNSSIQFADLGGHLLSDLSRCTYATIKRGWFSACIQSDRHPLAAFGFLNPVIAGAAMAFSSVSVVANALLPRAMTKLGVRSAERRTAAAT